jgi:clan AA aspartic protease
MTGRVVGYQARLGVVFRLPRQPDLEIEFVIDTGFESTLTLRISAVAAMQLPFYQRIRANLADNSVRMVDVHKATILWDGQEEAVAVLAMGQRPLLGTMLLAGHDLAIHFEDGGDLSLLPFPSP